MHHDLARATKIAKLLDSQFSIAGFRFGIDGIIGMVPGFGDIVTTGFSLYLLWVGWQMKLPTEALVRMAINVGIDTLLGTIPIVGDIADILYKANLRNLAILQQHDVGEFEEAEILSRESKTRHLKT